MLITSELLYQLSYVGPGTRESGGTDDPSGRLGAECSIDFPGCHRAGVVRGFRRDGGSGTCFGGPRLPKMFD